MEVKLFAKMEALDEFKWIAPNTERMLDVVASQSRKPKPLDSPPREGLFRDTILWRHGEIQEFADYIFWIDGVSRTELQQHARHRLASKNVKSGRHNPPDKVTVPEGIEEGEATIILSDGNKLLWKFDSQGNFSSEIVGMNANTVSLENIRMTYPDSVQVAFFFKINGRSLRNFFRLRLDEHAQWEIRELAHILYDYIEKDCPPMVKRLDPYKTLRTKMEEVMDKMYANLDECDNSHNSGFWVIEEMKKLLEQDKKGEI